MFRVFGLGGKVEGIGWFLRIVLCCFVGVVWGVVWFLGNPGFLFLFSFSPSCYVFLFGVFLFLLVRKWREAENREGGNDGGVPNLVWWGGDWGCRWNAHALYVSFFFFLRPFSLSELLLLLFFYSKYMDLPLLSLWGLLFLLIGMGLDLCLIFICWT